MDTRINGGAIVLPHFSNFPGTCKKCANSDKMLALPVCTIAVHIIIA